MASRSAFATPGRSATSVARPRAWRYRTSGGPTTIDNSGTVLGTVNLGYRDDTFNNRVGAIWNSAGGTNDFGGGTNAVNNEGLVVRPQILP